MAGAIWSTRSDDIAAFSARALFGFYENHELFAGLGGAVQWRTVSGGSRQYVEKVMAELGDRVQLGADVASVENGGRVRFRDGSEMTFDQVILATHSDEALALHGDADQQTRDLLSAIRFAPNTAYLHRDESLMPKNKRTWSSWNALTGGNAEAKGASLTYWMNRLQNIDREIPLFVTLNPVREPDPALTFLNVEYAHPQYDAAAFAAQEAFDAVQGRGNIWYAGAWLGYGFHEDGLRAGVRVANALGSRPDWVKDVGAPMTSCNQMAAE
jgi:predicted NAD/FAD-binding protein